jgi:nucleoside-diphosphate-sugar epimerase
MKKILITGSQGFIGSYLCAEFLERGYQVIGIDDFSKYGPITRAHDNHPNFELIEMDAINLDPRRNWRHPALTDIDYIIAGAAMIGGITYFHKYAYDLLAINERILASTFDLAIKLNQDHNLKRIIVLSSSMVFENTDVYPTPESEIKTCAPPLSTYGFQKLAVEYFCKGALEQYNLPYTIIRPFNCVGVGEEDAIGEHEVKSGNIKLMMSHVLPDIINKILKGQNPLHILGSGEQIRCYTNGKDIARGIRMCLESKAAINEDFNISTPVATSVLELAQLVWEILNPGEEFTFVSDEAYEYDVQKRIPNISKAKEVIGFEAEVGLEESVREVIDYMRGKNE